MNDYKVIRENENMARLILQNENGVVWFEHAGQVYGSSKPSELLDCEGKQFFCDRVKQGYHWEDFGEMTENGVLFEDAEIIFNPDGSLSTKPLVGGG